VTWLRDIVSLSLREALLVDKITRSEILRSPVFLFLTLIALVPLAIQLLQTNTEILYGLAVWSAVLWALLLYRLFADSELSFGWALGTLLFTTFVAFPMLEIFVWLPPHVSGWFTGHESLALRLTGYSAGVGLREELFKAVPLFGLAVFSQRMRHPANGLVLGMMSGVGFAAAENVYYVFQTVGRALSAVEETGSLAYLVVPVYNNVVRMAMTPFLHGCFSGIFGYFIARAAVDRARRIPLVVVGLGLAAVLHGLYDTLVGTSPLLGLLVEGAAFFLLMTYVLKARGLHSAHELGGGVFRRQSAVVPIASWRLRGIAGPATGHTFPLSFAEVYLGRDPERCTVHLAEPIVSRQHASIGPDSDGRWRLRRLSLTAPVFVNGAAVIEATLRVGDQLKLGSSILVLESGA
jgi:RsiW-degrading membrane proteinase PrsW (M82 family)